MPIEIPRPFIADIRDRTVANTDLVADHLTEMVGRIERVMDLQHEIANQHFWVLAGLTGPSQVTRLHVSAFVRDLVQLYSALELSRRGLVVPARTLMRHTFESVVIAKFCSISADDRVLQRWLSGEIIYFSKAILQKIVAPSPAPLQKFWTVMSSFSHATREAQQHEIDVAAMWDRVVLNLQFIELLLECTYHTLSTHTITSSMVYYSKMYHPNYQAPQLREEARSLMRQARSEWGDQLKELGDTFRRRWVLRASAA